MTPGGAADRSGHRASQAVGSRVSALVGGVNPSAASVSGGSICAAWRVRVGLGGSQDGGPFVSYFAKTLDDAPPGFFAAEAAGLRLLRETGAVAVPGVVAEEPGLLLLEWIDPGAPSPAQAERLGRDLAALHGTPAPSYGTPGQPGFLGSVPLPSPDEPVTRAEDWPAFHAEYRLLPLLRRAVARDALAPAGVRAVERLCEELPEVAGPPQPPAVIHGDLWSGNVHWAADGRARLIDPAAQGGHPETDLALLELFGCPQRSRVLGAYEELRPLPGRAGRVPLHQLQHLLVHAVLFGSGYGAQCGAAARAALG